LSADSFLSLLSAAADVRRKRDARAAHRRSEFAHKLHGLRAKLVNKRRYAEKAAMKKAVLAHSQRDVVHDNAESSGAPPATAVPSYLLDRHGQNRAKVLSNSIKQKRKEKAGKYSVPVPRTRGISEAEMFRVIRTGRTRGKAWKRLITKATFVGDGFTRRPPKYERFIRPRALRFTKAHVVHPELQTTFQLQILAVKKNPQSALYTQLGVMTKGTVIEVNVSELGLVTTSGKVVWGKYAQVTNNPENDGCVNAVLLV
jgi:ribosome biogenesis protein NSA2